MIREFCNKDWYGFSGSRQFDDKHPPLLREGKNYLAIADHNGFEVRAEDNFSESFSLDVRLTYAMARLILEALPEFISFEDQLIALGFLKGPSK